MQRVEYCFARKGSLLRGTFPEAKHRTLPSYLPDQRLSRLQRRLKDLRRSVFPCWKGKPCKLHHNKEAHNSEQSDGRTLGQKRVSEKRDVCPDVQHETNGYAIG